MRSLPLEPTWDGASRRSSAPASAWRWVPSSAGRIGPGNRYSQVAEALGGYTERIERPEAIQPALKRCIQRAASGRAALLEVITREDATLPME
jgi:thiamine pyrophosphate-dependent acetolactate synthase large subunit-like protein